MSLHITVATIYFPHGSIVSYILHSYFFHNCIQHYNVCIASVVPRGELY